ncbi:MAG: hypothetical protein NTW69_15420 [Chloroflexi bacterium]|nr:hypothetical protein [Chloroflexota bacterium]
MTIPSLLLALTIALLFGVLYYLIRGGSGWWFLLSIGLSVVGFALGELIGMWRGWTFFALGSINIGMGILGSAILLGIGDWLGRVSK